VCNEYQLILPFDDVIEAFNQTGDRLVFPGGMPNFGPMASIRIGDRAPVIRLGASGPEAVMTPWAWKAPQGRPVFTSDLTAARSRRRIGASYWRMASSSSPTPNRDRSEKPNGASPWPVRRCSGWRV